MEISILKHISRNGITTRFFETTKVKASLTSEQPIAARCRVPNSFEIVLSVKGDSTDTQQFYHWWQSHCFTIV